MNKLKVGFLKEKPSILIVSFFIIGILVGVVVAQNIDEIKQIELNEYIYKGILHMKEISIQYNEYFFKNLFRYIKFIIIIWVLGLIPYGYVLSYILLFVKGFLYGFTEAFLTRQFNINGLLFGLVAYLPQNLIFLPVLYFLAKASIKNSLSVTQKNFSYKNNKTYLIEYLLLFFVSLVCYLLGCIIESYITPRILKYFVKFF